MKWQRFQSLIVLAVVGLGNPAGAAGSCPEEFQVGGECPPNPNADFWRDKGGQDSENTVPLDDRGMRLCSDPAIIEQALDSRSEGKFGHIDETWVRLMVLDHVVPMGINNETGGKYCTAYFTCDIAAARRIESRNMGPHPLTALCFAVNQSFAAGNPYYIKFYTSPTGENGQDVTAYHDPGDPP
jgi:hypothetical protein